MGWPSDESLSEEQRRLIADATDAYGPGRQALVRSVILLTNSLERSGRVLTYLTAVLVVLTLVLVVLTVLLLE